MAKLSEIIGQVGVAQRNHTHTKSEVTDFGNVVYEDAHTTLKAGFDSLDEDLGIIDTGSITLEVKGSNDKPNFKTLNANGAFEILPQANSGSSTIVVEVTNGPAAGMITTSSYTFVNGDPYDTSNGNVFYFHSKKVGSTSVLTIEALQ